MVSKKLEKACKILNDIDICLFKHLLIASLFAIGIWSSAVGSKICSVTAGIKKYKSVIMKKKTIKP